MVKYIKMYSNSGFIKEPATETIINHCMWWLILFVNLTGPWDAQIFGQVLFCLCLWGCFWMRLVFKLGDKQSKVDCFPYENSSYLMVFELGHWLFSCLQTPTETSPLLRSQACRPLKWNNMMNSPRSPTCWLCLQMLVTAILCNVMSQFLAVNFFLSLSITCLYPIGSVYLEKFNELHLPIKTIKLIIIKTSTAVGRLVFSRNIIKMKFSTFLDDCLAIFLKISYFEIQ